MVNPVVSFFYPIEVSTDFSTSRFFDVRCPVSLESIEAMLWMLTVADSPSNFLGCHRLPKVVYDPEALPGGLSE